MQQRLRVCPGVATGGRVARVPDRECAMQPAQLRLVKYLGDEPEVAQSREATVIGHGDAC